MSVSKHGNDQNSGRSSAEPYASLFATVNQSEAAARRPDSCWKTRFRFCRISFYRLQDSGSRRISRLRSVHMRIGRRRSSIRLIIAANGTGNLVSGLWIRAGFPGTCPAADMYPLRYLLYDVEYVTLSGSRDDKQRAGKLSGKATVHRIK